jgi:peptide/nickel transport system permease protein
MSASAAPLQAEFGPTGVRRSQKQMVWMRFRKHKAAMIGGAILLLMVLVTLFAPVIATHNPDRIGFPYCRNCGPSADHYLGTDELSRDIFSRLIYAGRVSLSVAFLATTFGTIVGVLVGGIAGYYGGRVEMVLMRFTDVMLSLPALPLLLIIGVLLGPGFRTIVLVLTLFGWMGVARLVHGSFLSLRAEAFTEAAVALGASGWRIIFRHLLPNSLAPIIVAATLTIGGTVIAEATLSFLGFGIPPRQASWGNMLQGAQTRIFQNPLLTFYPGIAIFLVVISANFLGDGLRDALDPRAREG